MNIYSYEKVNNFRIFSPRADNSYRRLKLNNQNNVGNFNEYSKFSSIGNDNPINIYYSPKNISSPQNSKIPKIYSPLHRKLNRLYRSSSQKRMSRPLSSSARALPSVQSFSYIKSPKSKNKNKSKIKDKKQNYFNIEKEKLYQETYQIKKVVKILTKKLSLLKQENLKKDNQINRKQKKINDIIFSNNDSMYENTNLLHNNNINNNSFNDFSINSSINMNNNNNNMSINSNLNIMNKKNLPTLSLIIKIKKAITQMNNEIKTEKEKYEKLKRSLFLTKMNELKTESTILEEQINKIKTFVNKAFILQEENNKKKNDYLNLKDNINKQLDIIKSLNERSNLLDKEENDLKDNLDKIKRNLISKNKKIKINKSKLDLLIEKNNDLSNNKNMIEQSYTVKINNMPIEIKSFYTSQISKLNKLINFYTTQCKYSDNEINKLKDKRFKLIGMEKEEKSNHKGYEYFSLKNETNLSDNEKINNLRKILKDSNDAETLLKKKLSLYQNKLKELENPQDQEDMSNKSQIEFGIDIDNPYYTDDNDNHPDISNKFTSSQFNQFTYILFKNFEAKGISFEESKSKVINPFIEFYNKNNISNVVYPSNEFDLFVNGCTKIIMEVLNCGNKYNFTLTKIFISALFYNSECDVNKLIEYFNVLFSYTRNYILEEGKYITKLQNKYKEQTEKLISSIKDNIINYMNTNTSKYFHLLKMKELLEHNEINLKDKYIEFLFYYMKKFDDPDAKLGDLKYSLLNDIIPLDEFENNNISNMNIINNNNKEEDSKVINKESQKESQKESLQEIQKQSQKESQKESRKETPKEAKESQKEIKDISKDSNKDKTNKKEEIDFNDDKFIKNDKKSVTDENFSKKSKKNNTEKNDKDNSDDLDDDEDSMTEITNEEYVKQLSEAITLMHEGLKKENTNFNDLMTNVIQKRKINGKFYECITIEDFNDQLKTINIVLSDLKLSCLCSKYSIPNELRLIDKNKIEIDIQKHINGTLKLDEEENDNN